MTSAKCEHCGSLLDGRRQKRFCSPGCACKFHHLLKTAERRKRGTPPPPVDGARWLPLSDGGFALVDADRFEELNEYHWYRSKWGYTVRMEGAQCIWLHRVVLRTANELDVDHKNGKRWDCRKDNLRPATCSQNRMNQGKVGRCTSKYKGVCFVARRGSWFMQIQKNRVKVGSAYFKTEEEAARAYDEAARKHHGEFARLNFPRPGEQSALSD